MTLIQKIAEKIQDKHDLQLANPDIQTRINEAIEDALAIGMDIGYDLNDKLNEG